MEQGMKDDKETEKLKERLRGGLGGIMDARPRHPIDDTQDAVMRIVARLEGRIEAMQEHLNHLRLEIERKDAQILEMKREGFMPPPMQPGRIEVTDQGPELPEDVLLAIQAIAEPGTPFYEQQLREAALAMKEEPDLDVAVLAKSIRRGSETNPHHW